ncbi:MAG TPA: histidine phosphatase family protein [Pyrinomonadaceae bacterium]|nr:histidine phosphatase family protein [Pyrinomonadaceae bacterium]
MKTLLLLRHGKSSWDDPGMEDFDRPLNERGVQDAKLSGKYARAQKLKPDLVLSSPATRAKSTTELFMAAAGLKNPPAYDERIYEASARRLMQVLSEFDDDYESVLLVGHNPGFEDLCERLTGVAKKVPTASLTCIDLKIDKWAAPKGGKGKLKWRITPKKLKKDGMKGRTQSLRETP